MRWCLYLNNTTTGSASRGLMLHCTTYLEHSQRSQSHRHQTPSARIENEQLNMKRYHLMIYVSGNKDPQSTSYDANTSYVCVCTEHYRYTYMQVPRTAHSHNYSHSMARALIVIHQLAAVQLLSPVARQV